MFKLAIKNIIHRRASYVWLLVELALVSFLSWFVVDELVVLTYQYSRNPGYDIDRLAVIKYQASWDNGTDDPLSFIASVRAMPEVEYATFGVWGAIPEGQFYSSTDIPINDSTYVRATDVNYIAGQDFFQTFGIDAVDGTSREALSNLEGANGLAEDGTLTLSGSDPVLMTESLARLRYPGGHPMESNDSALAVNKYTTKILAITNDVMTYTSKYNSVYLQFRPLPLQLVAGHNTVVARMRPGYKPADFVDRLNLDLDALRTGELTVESVQTYSSMAEENEYTATGIDRKVNRIVAIFFLLNIAVGVTGTFWMMTRRRTREVGVLRAFGATPGRVRRLLVSEACVAGFTGWLLGCSAFLYWALHHGLYKPEDASEGLLKTWIDNFPLHFSVVAAVILLLILVAVVLGVLLPAWRLSRVAPVDALRDE